MEFGEKLQQLRKSRGMTQEELAAALYVSRTAVSKWESGRGYPSIDSLKQISAYFSVTIDDLLSGEKLISIARQESRTNGRYLWGLADLFTLLLIVLPLYPRTGEGGVYAVNLAAYTETSPLNRAVYWAMFLSLTATGVWKLALTCLGAERFQKTAACCSLVLSILAVLFLALAGETYAVALVFLLLVAKGVLLLRASGSRR